MSKFVIAIEVNLNDMESKNPKLWMQRTIGSITMRKVGNITSKAVGEPVKEVAKK
jgi:hypothetical protein